MPDRANERECAGCAPNVWADGAGGSEITIDALPYVIVIIAVAVILMIGIDRLMARLGIRPVDPDAARGGFSDLVAVARRWLQNRR